MTRAIEKHNISENHEFLLVRKISAQAKAKNSSPEFGLHAVQLEY